MWDELNYSPPDLTGFFRHLRGEMVFRLRARIFPCFQEGFLTFILLYIEKEGIFKGNSNTGYRR